MCRRRRARTCRDAADTGRGPFLDAEQFGFEQGFNQDGAVDRDERPLPPATEFVDLRSDQLFADPAFPPKRPVVEPHSIGDSVWICRRIIWAQVGENAWARTLARIVAV